jgi:hypothetical protein
MPFLFNSDKSQVPFKNVFDPAFDERLDEKFNQVLLARRVKLWQGNGTDYDGITINFNSLNINLSDYRYLMLVGIFYDTEINQNVLEATLIIPTNIKFFGAITSADQDTYDPSLTTIMTYQRNVKCGYTNNVLTIDKCTYTAAKYNSQDEIQSQRGGIMSGNLVPYEVWGFV